MVFRGCHTKKKKEKEDNLMKTSQSNHTLTLSIILANLLCITIYVEPHHRSVANIMKSITIYELSSLESSFQWSLGVLILQN